MLQDNSICHELASKADRSKVLFILQLRVRAYDSSFPTQIAETDVNIFVVRNDNPPIFQNEPYTVFLDENQPIGQSVENVLATDADQVRKGKDKAWNSSSQPW